MNEVSIVYWPTLMYAWGPEIEVAYNDLCATVQIAKSVGITPQERDAILSNADLLTAEGMRAYEAALRAEVYRRQAIPVVKEKPPLIPIVAIQPLPAFKAPLIGFDCVTRI